MIEVVYQLRYLWHVALRKLRIAPFGRRAKDFMTLDELMADYERDPEMRQIIREVTGAKA